MQNYKYAHKSMLIGSVVTFVMLGGGGLINAQDLSSLVKANSSTACSAGSSYACFNFQNATFTNNGTFTLTGTMPTVTSGSWNSFGGSGGDFTSTSNLSGQTTDTSGNILSLDLNLSKLVLTAPTKTNSSDPKWSFALAGKTTPIMLYITGLGNNNDLTQTKDQMLTINTSNSLLVGNIMIASKLSTLTSDKSQTKRTFGLAKMIFSGNSTYAEGDGAKLTTNASLPINGGQYALVGSIINNNGGQVNVEFKDGAKMFGDIRANSSSQAKNTFSFGGNYSNTYAFEGSISSTSGGTNTITFNTGNAYTHSIALGANYGLFAQTNGVNMIYFGSGTQQGSAQTLKTIAIRSSTNTSNKTNNTVTFQNGVNSGNKLNIIQDSRDKYTGEIRATSSTNNIYTKSITGHTTTLDITIDRSIYALMDSTDTTTTDNHAINNIIVDGSLQVGRYALLNNESSSGLVSYSGKNQITLGEVTWSTTPSASTAGLTYNASRSLETGLIQASFGKANDTNFYGENIVTIDGDLTLSYAINNGIINGGSITAISGGTNEITIAGNLKSLQITPDMSGTTYSVTTMDNMRISASASPDNSNVSKNTITIKNTNGNGEDITLGSIYASGGENFITMYGKTKNVNIIYTYSSQESESISGHNKLLTIDGSQVTFDNIITEGGTNDIAVLKTATQTSQTSNLKISYGVVGTTNLHFGNVNTTASSSDGAIQLTLGNSGTTSNLDIKVERTSGKFDVTFGNGTDFSYFFGDIKKLGSGISNDKYYVENNAIFTPNTMGKTKAKAEIDLTLKAGGKLVLENDFALSSLTLQNSTNQAGDHLGNTRDLASTVIDLATGGGDYLNITRNTGRTLTIDSLTLNGSGKGYALLRVYSGGDANNTDKVTATNLTPTTTTLDTQVFLPLSLVGQDLSSKNLVIFSAQNGGGNLELVSKEAKTGFATYTVEIIKESASGGNPTTWKLGGTSNAKVASGASDFSNVILPLNYTNWNSNINSLNKRMGELRDNPYNQGVWARVFTGEQTNSQAKAQINMSYLTLQGGYDYGIALDDARNYIGLALSYGMSSAQSEKFYDSFNTAYEYDAKSSNIEVGLYNSYVQNSGLYTDSIFKFSYITSNFDGINASSANTTVSNYAMSFGQEVGYRLKFGEKQDWYFDPQAEIVFGYFSQTDFDQTFEQQVLNSSLNAMFLARARVGADLAYSLKTTKDTYDFRAGLSYVYDYVNNGNAQFSILNSSIATLVENGVITSDQRLVLNVGTNMQINDEVRLYVDFETSFLGEIQTKYQVNAGVRYSFGEKIQAQITEEENNQEYVAPLKIQDQKQKDETPKQEQKQ